MVVLFPACELTGRVLDVHGKPVAGAPVLGGSSEVDARNGPDPEVVRGVTDPDGRFALEGLLRGTVQVFAGWPRRTRTRGAGGRSVTRTIDVTLPGGIPIEGRVTGLDPRRRSKAPSWRSVSMATAARSRPTAPRGPTPRARTASRGSPPTSGRT